MKPLAVFVFALWTYTNQFACGDDSALCLSWKSLEQNLNTEDFKLICEKDKDCQSLNCSGTAHGYLVNTRIQLYACENPPSIEFNVDIPHLSVNKFKQRIYHNSSISLTKNLNVEFEVERNDQQLFLSIFLHYIFNGSLPLLHVSPKIPIASHIRFPIDCSSEAHQTVLRNQTTATVSPSEPSIYLSKRLGQSHSNCSIVNSSCSSDEICLQISKEGQDGICVCISGFKRNESGRCVYDPSAQPSTDPHQNPSKKATSSVSLLLTAILVPVVVILLLVGGVYAAIRFRVFQHLRRRLRVQVYEHVLLGEEEADEEDDLQNPVA